MHGAAEGSGSAVLVVGEAGIGKTRLVCNDGFRWRAMRRISGSGGRCLDLVGTELPFQPFVEALGARPGDDAGSQLQVFDEVLETLTGLAAAAPVLLVLEDLHWADMFDSRFGRLPRPQPRRAPGGAGRDLPCGRGRGCRAAATTRSTVFGARGRRSWSIWGHWSATRWRRCWRLGPATSASPALTAAIVARSEGNPFFAEELLAAAGDECDELPRAWAIC